MEALTSFWILLVPLAGALGWGACHWWFGRKLRRLDHRFGKLNADREALQEQLKRARQQLGQVQKELSAQRDAAAGAPSKAAAPPQRASAPVAAKATPELAGGLVFERPQTAAHGFADTLPFAEPPT